VINQKPLHRRNGCHLIISWISNDRHVIATSQAPLSLTSYVLNLSRNVIEYAGPAYNSYHMGSAAFLAFRPRRTTFGAGQKSERQVCTICTLSAAAKDIRLCTLSEAICLRPCFAAYKQTNKLFFDNEAQRHISVSQSFSHVVYTDFDKNGVTNYLLSVWLCRYNDKLICVCSLCKQRFLQYRTWKETSVMPSLHVQSISWLRIIFL